MTNAFNILAGEYRPMVLAYLRAMVRDAHLAEDLVQETPLSKEKLETEATHVVRGKVLDVTTKVEKSKIETDSGVHKDTIYTITVLMEAVSKGAEAKKGGKVTVLAWKPHTREPNARRRRCEPALQGLPAPVERTSLNPGG